MFQRARDIVTDGIGWVLAIVVVAALASAFLWVILALRAILQEAQ